MCKMCEINEKYTRTNECYGFAFGQKKHNTDQDFAGIVSRNGYILTTCVAL